MIYLFAFIASLLFVGLRSFQQLNVMKNRIGLIPPTSYAMSLCEVFLIGWVASSNTVDEKLMLAFFLGSGAWMGSVSATIIHRRIG